MATALAVYCCLMLLAGTARAARNITIAASDTSIDYSPDNAWQTRNGQSANVGDGTARIATQNGATASLTFTGTAIYFQTVRAANHGVATINLDGADFKIDSSGNGGPSTGDTGVVWGIVSLKDTTHKITVTQSQTTGVEVSINAFIYTSSGDGPAPGEDPSPLSPGNSHFARNTALIAVFAGILAFCLGIVAFWLIKRCKKQRKLRSSIGLDSSPVTPLSLGGKHASMSSSSHVTRSGSQRSAIPMEPQLNVLGASPRPHEPDSAHPAGHPAVDLNDTEAVRQARTLHPLNTGNQQYQSSPFSGVSSSSANSGRALLSASNDSSANSQDQAVSMSWRSSEPSGSSSGRSPLQEASTSRIRNRMADEDRNRPMLLPEEHEDEKSAELARRLREAGSITSSHLPAGFSVVRAPSPPPAYAERLTRQYAAASSSSSEAGPSRLPRGSLAKDGSSL